ncbi:DUF4398 domain-containing protein [Stutzerimonas nitrititolerans]|uniref:DUF4398 domain-containing protein n=1 Tax=Stutzerimonas nitrititolerans TaxID=2482751 RepID=UPI0035E3C009
MKRSLFGLCVLFALGGCVHDPVPTEQLKLTEQMMVQARAVGVTEQVGELALAEQKLADVHVAMKHKRYRQARMLAEQAELDARLAEARTLDEKSRTEVAEVNRQIERLRQQLGELR